MIGPNGAGKSTLFRGLAGILKPLSGSIDLGGLDIRDIAYLPQSVDIDRSFPISVFDLVGTGLWRTTGFFGGMGKAERDKITQALAAVGLNGFENRSIGTLSGGQMQRMLFARVLLQDARLIVLDEPFNAIDAKTSADLLALVKRWHGEGRTVLAALHDMELVRDHFPETLLLARGPVAWGATAEVLTAENLMVALRMCEAFDDTCRRLRGRYAVTGRLMLYDALIAPFTEFEFMRRALAAVIALALGAAPIGVFLMLRRMSLVGDAMAHAILPGAAIGFLVSGLNLFAMTTGGLIAGFTVAILAGLVARHTELKEDASLATFYLVSLALGVTIVSVKGTNIDLLHVLFGNILAMDDQTLLVIAFNATITLLVHGRDLPAAGDRMRRSGIPAHRLPRRCARASGVPGAGRHQPRQRLSRARHAARRRPDDPARRHRAVLVARHHRHDLHRGRKRDCLGLCRAGAVVPDQNSLRPGDHPDRGGALCDLAAVRQCQRPGAADVPRPSSRGVVMMRFWLIALALLAAAGPARAADRLNVVASFSILGDFVRNVGGDRVNVTTLVGPNSDAHVYVPTPADAKKVADAKLVFVNGLGFEGWLSRLVKSAGGKASVVTATTGIAPLKLGSEADPHAWQSVANAKIYVANIRDALARPLLRMPKPSSPMRTPIWLNSTRWSARCARRSRKFRKAAAR